MSNLQLSLVIAGALVLLGVLAYNAWITRNSEPRSVRRQKAKRPGGPTPPSAANQPGLAPETARPTARHPVSAGMPDDHGRTEPFFDPQEADTLPAALDPLHAAPAEPQLQVQGPDADDGLEAATVSVKLKNVITAPEKRPGLDALIDVITPMMLDAPVSGDALLAALPGTRRVGSKPFAVEGQNERTDEWESPHAGQRYRALQAGIQLANRSGALNEIEFSEFVVKVQAYADAVGAAPEFPDMRAEVARARELDAFASGHDAQLGFTLRARRAAWSPGFVTQKSAQLGFVAGALPGRMVLPASQGRQAPILSLSFDPQAAMADDPEQSALREIKLSLEVTHVPRNEQAYVRMRQAAAALAESMDGVVTDDHGQALGKETMDLIGSDLETLYDALDAHDLSAGSDQARRLFS